MDDEYETTLEEVTQLVFDTDVYERVKKICASQNYEINHVFFEVVHAINIHYLPFLKQYSMEGNRREYLIERIDRELSYYEKNS